MAFRFDENKNAAENLELFFEHAKSVDADFGTLLERMLPEFIAGTKDRAEVNAVICDFLDNQTEATQ